MSVKKIYLVLSIIIIAFLSYQCGGDNKNDNAQTKENKMKTNDDFRKYVGNPVLGKEYFMKTCVACHGADAKGLPKLGKDLTTSQFIKDKTNKELVEYVEVGRLPSDPLNTTGIAMPPKGGNPALTEKEIIDIVSYVRTINK